MKRIKDIYFNIHQYFIEMKKAVINICLLVLAAANIFSQQSDFPKLTGPYLGQKPPGRSPVPKLNEKLSIFKPFIGLTWVGSIPNDPRMGEIILNWKAILNGFAVRLERNILNSGHWLETTYYWDESSEKIAYLALSNNGFVSKGYVAGRGEELVSEGDQHGPDVNRRVRRIYKLDKDGKLYEDDQFRNSDADEWRRTHVSVFVRSIRR